MPDVDMRELQRQAASGDTHARARLLLERIRTSDLPREHLHLAAYLEDEAACEAWAVLEGPVPAIRDDSEWVQGLPCWNIAAVSQSVKAVSLLLRSPNRRKEYPGELDSFIEAAAQRLKANSPATDWDQDVYLVVRRAARRVVQGALIRCALRDALLPWLLEGQRPTDASPLERVRTGDLDLGRVKLAASLGALNATEACAELGESVPSGLTISLLSRPSNAPPSALEEASADVQMRAAVAAVRVALTSWEEHFPSEPMPWELLRAVEEWIVFGFTHQVAQVTEARTRLSSFLELIPDSVGWTLAGRAVVAGRAVCVLASMVEGSPALHMVLRECAAALSRPHPDIPNAMEMDEVPVLDAIALDLIPWLLDLADPVRERVNDRLASKDAG